MKRSLRLAAICCMTALAFTACTKTETIAPPAEDAAKILEYKIVNVQGQPIYGAVNEKDTTISVYLPIYRELVVLEPEIKVSEGATVKPETGTLIEDLLTVLRSDEPIKYIVTSREGKSRTYTLKIEVQQPALTLEELSTATEVQEYTIDMTAFYSDIRFAIKGAGFHENHDLIKVVLVDEAGKDSPPLTIAFSTNNDLSRLDVSVTKFEEPHDPLLLHLPATGLYKVRVYVYGKAATMQYPIRINKLQ